MIRTTKRHRERTSAIALMCLVMAMTFGCAHSIKTERAKLAPLPPGAPLIHTAPGAVSDSASMPALDYDRYAEDLATSLDAQARHQISSNEDAPLVLAEVNISAQPPPFQQVAGFSLAFFSFFIPPLSFIPESSTFPYTIDYTIDDRAGREVAKGKVHDEVKGKISGFYIGRITAAKELLVAEGRFVAENGATLLLNDLRRRTVQLAAAASHYRENPELTAKEAIAARDRQQARRQARARTLLRAQQLAAQTPYAQPGSQFVRTASPTVLAAAPARAPVPIQRIAVLMKPAVIGPPQEMQDTILHGGMRSKLAETHTVVSVAETESAVGKALAELGETECASDACHTMVLQITGAEELYTLRILREESGAQLRVGARTLDKRSSKASYCDGCGTGKLDTEVSELTTGLVAQLAPPAPPPAAMPGMSGAAPASGAMAQPTAATAVAGAAGDMAKQCLAKTAAAQACNFAPGFAKIGCRIAIQAKFGNLPCPGL